MLCCIPQTAVGFIGCSAVRQPSWLSEFSEFSVARGWVAGWIRWQCQISDINHQPPPPVLLLLLSAVSPFYSPLLLLLLLLLLCPHPLSYLCCRACHQNSPLLLQFTLCFYLSTYLLPSPCTPLSIPSVSQSHMYIQGSSRQADSTGFVMNGILLHIRRKCTLQCGFTNCLYCPKNDSLYTAENGSQPDSQTDRQHSANRQTSLQSLQTNSTRTTGRETDSL